MNEIIDEIIGCILTALAGIGVISLAIFAAVVLGA